MSKKTKYSLLILAMFIFALFIAFQNKYLVSADAATPIKHLSGYAWSSNIGWISFSGGGASPLYEVTYDSNPTSAGYRSLSGYAWSSNIGWISFGCGQPDGTTGRKLCSQDMSGGEPAYPVADGSVASGPKMSSGDDKLIGFARACSVFASGCSGGLAGGVSQPVDSPDLGGWDGWISLSGNTSQSPVSSYGVSFNGSNNKFRGYAWGGGDISSQVPGWISWSSDDGSGSGGAIPEYGVVLMDTPVVGTVVTCERSSYPVVGVPITWTASVEPAGQYSYHWSLGGTPGEDYTVVGDVNSSSIVVTYKKPGPLTTDVTVTDTDSGGTIVGQCPVSVSSFRVLDKGFVINHTGDMSAGFLPDRGITTFTYPNIPITIDALGEYTSPVTLVFKRIENSDHSIIGSANAASSPTPALIVTAQFRNDKHPTADSTIFLENSGGVYDSASLRLILTKNQDEAASDLTLPSGDYNVIIDSSPSGHEHSIILHLSNPTGGVRER